MAATKPAWEMIVKGEGDYTERLAVPGGWLYRTDLRSRTSDGEEHITLAMCFVPAEPMPQRNRYLDKEGNIIR